MDSYDVIVIGGGHNGLVAAAYLARAGRSVLVLDAGDRPGGFVRTDEIATGYLADTYSGAHTLFTTGPAWADLRDDLGAHGLRYVQADPPSGVSMEDGTTAVLPGSLPELVEEADRLAPGDGAAVAGLLDEVGPHAEDVFSLFGMDLTSPQARRVRERLLGGDGGRGWSPFAASLFTTPREVVSRFSSPALRAVLGAWPTHVSKGPDEVGGGIWVSLFLQAFLAGGIPVPQGGGERLVDALVRVVTSHGGVVRTGERVTGIDVSDGRATAVATEHGERFRAAGAVIASVNPDQLYLRLLPAAHVPAELVSQARGYRYGRGQVQVNLALSAPPRWPDPRFETVGQPFLTDGLDGLALHVAQAHCGQLPARPTFSVQVPSAVDATRAPSGGAVMRLQVTDVPTRVRGDAAGEVDVGDGRWTGELTDRFVDRVLHLAEHHVPGLLDTVVSLSAVTPDALAACNPNAGPGDPYGGSQTLAQSFLLRPLPGQPSHRTHVPNLWTTGAGTWPGGGVSGSSGYIVAQQVLAT